MMYILIALSIAFTAGAVKQKDCHAYYYEESDKSLAIGRKAIFSTELDSVQQEVFLGMNKGSLHSELTESSLTYMGKCKCPKVKLH